MRVYDSGTIFAPEILDIKPEDLRAKFMAGVANVAALSLSIGYPTLASAPHSIANGFKNLLAIAAVTEVEFKEAETIKEYIKVYDSGTIFAPEILDIKPEDLRAKFMAGVANVAALSLSIGYPTLASAPHSIANGFKNLLAIAAVTEVEFKEAETIKEYIKVYDSGTIFAPEILDIKPEDLRAKFMAGVANVAALSLSIGYPTLASAPHSIANGFKNLLAIAAVTEVEFKEAETIKEYIKVYDSGTIFAPEILDIKPEDLRAKFMAGVANVAALSLSIGYPTLASAPHSIANGFKNLLAIAAVTEVEFKEAETIKEYIKVYDSGTIFAPEILDIKPEDLRAKFMAGVANVAALSLSIGYPTLASAPHSIANGFKNLLAIAAVTEVEFKEAETIKEYIKVYDSGTIFAPEILDIKPEDLRAKFMAGVANVAALSLSIGYPTLASAPHSIANGFKNLLAIAAVTEVEFKEAETIKEYIKVYDSGTIFAPEILDIKPEDLRAKFMAGVANVAALSLSIGYPTLASAPHSIANGFKNLLAIAAVTEVEFKEAETIKEYIKVYDSGTIFAPEILDIKPEDLRAKFMAGVANVAALSLSIGYPTLASAPHSIANGFKNLLAIAAVTEVEFKEAETIKEYIKVYDSGTIFAPEILDIKPEDLRAKFMAGVANVAALSLSIGYPTLASAPHSIANGFKNLLAIAAVTEVEFKEAETIKEYIKVYDSGTIFAPEILDIKPEDLRAKFMAGVANVAALSLSIGYPTLASAPHSIANGFKNLLAIAAVTEVEFKEAETIKEYIKDPSKFAAVAAALAAAAAPAAAAKEDKKEVKEESEESDGDLGFGLFD